MFLSKITAVAVLALSLIAAPVFARDLDAGTYELIEYAEELGVTVITNGPNCKGQYGTFSPRTMTIDVCKVSIVNGKADMEAHSTVRHEMIHVAQYCAAKRQGRLSYVTLMEDKDKFATFVADSITPEAIKSILANYPKKHVAPELEAAAAERVVSATEILDIVKFRCRDGL